jgi:hypothetical protein
MNLSTKVKNFQENLINDSKVHLNKILNKYKYKKR